MIFLLKEDILAPPPESDDVINDFDIEDEVIEVENRCVNKQVLLNHPWYVYVC